jgi:hypothetical protein
MLDPGTLNLLACGEDSVYSPPNPQIEVYLWDELFNAKRGANKPIALLPPRLNPRIVAQQGVFTLHGRSKEPLDQIATASDPKGKLQLARIILDKNNLAGFADDLGLMGVGQHTLFPELDSVAEFVKWAHQRP